MEDNHQYRQYSFPELSGSNDADSNDPRHCDSAGQKTNIPDIAMAESQAFDEGYEQGRGKTLSREKEKAGSIQEILVDATECMHQHHQMIRGMVQSEGMRMALELADRIIKHAINSDPETAIQNLENVIQVAVKHDHVKIKLNPEDDKTVRNIILEAFPDVDIDQQFEFITDRSIHRGGCLVETDYGIVDARIDQQLEAIAGELKNVMSAQPQQEDVEKATDILFNQFYHRIDACDPVKSCGHVTQVVGLVVEANGPVTQLGCVCEIHGNNGETPVKAEVLGFRDKTVLMMPLEEMRSIGPGNLVAARQQNASIPVGQQLLGRVIDGLGNPIDGLGPLNTEEEYPIYANPINPLLRQRIRKPLDIGVRAINGLLTVGCGQRMGIFAGSGVGKSVLMGIIARKSQADVNVIALIGERGRELNEFIERELGEEGLKKSVVIVATSDHLPLVRVRGAFVATAIAEFFRDQGLQVNLMMDSLTRFAMAQREIGLALGEPPTTKGYTPSVFTLLPRLLERAGTSDHAGAITGLYTVLVEGDDMNEPIADAARSILDGHIVLTRELADQNHYPAIDILKSVSRVMDDITGLQHKHNANRLKELLATYRKAEDLINIGAYVAGSNPRIDQAIERIEHINKYLKQDIQDNVHYEDSLEQLENIMNVNM